jgi:hypothetical protein
MIKPLREVAVRDTTIIKSFTLLGSSYRAMVENPG